ncbi:hypothetical protein ACFO3J_34935 [Streptomyces polygonati]|uniref:Integral membrane protein n=1 Tax=Streptomyces polygonati TaxID=1617087 RepID=A0ABV8HZR1_9ACTN
MVGPRAWACVSGLMAATVYALTSGFPTGLARGTPVGMALGLIAGVSRNRADGARQGLLTAAAVTVTVGAVALALHGGAVALHDSVELGVPLGPGVTLVGWMQSSTWRLAAGIGSIGLVTGCWSGAWDAVAKSPSDGLSRWLTTSLGMATAVAITSILVRATGSNGTPSQPTGLNTSLSNHWRELMLHLNAGAAAGSAIGFGGGTVIVLRELLAHHGRDGVHRAATLAIGFTGAFMRWLNRPPDHERAATPRTTLAAAPDRRRRRCAGTLGPSAPVSSACAVAAAHPSLRCHGAGQLGP